MLIILRKCILNIIINNRRFGPRDKCRCRMSESGAEYLTYIQSTINKYTEDLWAYTFSQSMYLNYIYAA